MGDTILSSEQSDVAVVRIHNKKKAVAITCDCNPIYCKSDPKIGAEIAVAESWRNLIASRCKTNCNNRQSKFWKSEKLEIMHEIKEAIKGIKKHVKNLIIQWFQETYHCTTRQKVIPFIRHQQLVV